MCSSKSSGRSGGVLAGLGGWWFGRCAPLEGLLFAAWELMDWEALWEFFAFLVGGGRLCDGFMFSAPALWPFSCRSEGFVFFLWLFAAGRLTF